MPINSDKPLRWKADVETSIDFYNDWFIQFAPATYRKQRKLRTEEVKSAFQLTNNLRNFTPEFLAKHPDVLPMLRMSTAPPLARDRLMGLAYADKNLVKCMEGKDGVPSCLPPRMKLERVQLQLANICDVLTELLDHDLFPWLEGSTSPSDASVARAAAVVADRLCGAAADPIIRNAQEQRQLKSLRKWLNKRGYTYVKSDTVSQATELAPGTFAFRLNMTVGIAAEEVQVPIDCVIQPHGAPPGQIPILIEAKSAGDATNPNKRRKEEAQKANQLRSRYGDGVQFLLLLCGYFEAGYLGYEAAEGIDWVWEHRLDDLAGVVSTSDEKKTAAPCVEESSVAYVATSGRETERYQIQTEIDATKTPVERNRLGQYSTPFPLAVAMVRQSLAYLSANSPIRFLEPAVGSGVFFSALSELPGVTSRLTVAVGVEIDSAYGNPARQFWATPPFAIRIEDFIEFSARAENKGQFTLLCTNPPYVRHHHMATETKTRAQSRVEQELGLRVSGLAGYYVYHMLLAHAVLAEEAVASWLVPSEFLVVNYGQVLRDYLRSRVELLSIHQFNPEEVQFDDALVSSCVVTYRKASPGRKKVTYSFGGSLDEPARREELALDSPALEGRWDLQREHQPDIEGMLRVCDLFDVKRGLATGANDFFILESDRAAALGLPKEFLRPVLPSPRLINELVIEADADGVPLLSQIRWLLDCSAAPEKVQRDYPALWRYLEEGHARGVADGYICSHRQHWYAEEQRPPAPILASYMGRSTLRSDTPIRFFRNQSRAVATNVFLNLYPRPFLQKQLRTDPARINQLHQILASICLDTLLRNGRAYGGGLHKMEPSELGNLPLPNAPEWLQVEKIEQLVFA